MYFNKKPTKDNITNSIKDVFVDTTINYAINNSIEHTISSNNIQEPMIELFPSPFWQSEY